MRCFGLCGGGQRFAVVPGDARHLAHVVRLYIAALSFFIDQAQVFATLVRIVSLLVVPILAVLATMLYRLWRVRIRRSLRGPVSVRPA